MKHLVLIFALAMTSAAFAEQQEDKVPVVSQDQLKNFQFDHRQKESAPIIKPLSPGQEFLMNKQRTDIKNLIARHLGIVALRRNKSDLHTIQQIYDRRLLKKSDLKDWQSVGVVFGDIVAKDFGLHWVSYQDKQGVSRALQWKRTQNFIFPVTLFSKRVRFNEKINAQEVYNKIKSDVEEFKAYEERLYGR